MQQEHKRVGAILSDKGGIVEFLGYGTYLGDLVPETDDVKFLGKSLKKIDRAIPCIKLDSGKKVYGCECWYGGEQKIKEMLANAKEIKHVDIEEIRKEYEQA